MGNLRFILVLTALCVVLESTLAQNRGSVRYGSTDYDSEETQPQRPTPSRGPIVRRRRPTTPPEQPEIENNPAPYQPHDSTTGRRTPSRGNSQLYAPPSSYHPVEETPSHVSSAVGEMPIETPKNSEDKTQGRRRRPKKRRRPQNPSTKITTDLDNENVDKSKVVADIVDADHNSPQSFHGNTEIRNNPNAYDSSIPLSDKPVWSNAKFDVNSEFTNNNNPETPRYFPPQTGTNRLPAEDTDTSAGYPEPPTALINQEVSSRRYIPPATQNKASYVPVLSPVQGHSRTSSRLPVEEYNENKEDTTRDIRPTVYDSSKDIINKDRRLTEDINNSRAPQPTNRLPNAAPGVQYESPYPSYLDDNSNSEEHSHVSAPHSRQESSRHSSSDNLRPYSNVVLQETPQNRNNDNSDRRNQERYEPPLQRAGSRYGVEGSEVPKISRTTLQVEPSEVPSRSRDASRSRSESSHTERSRTRDSSRDKPESINDSPIRTRDGSRYQSSSSADSLTRTRGSSRYQSDSSIETPTRTQDSSQYQQNSFSDTPTRTRTSSRSKPTNNANDAPSRSSQYPSQQIPNNRESVARYQPETNSPPRLSSQAQPVISVDSNRYAPESTYRGIDSVPQKEEVTVPHPYETPEEEYPIRNTLRSRPQFEVRDREQPYAYEESEEISQDSKIHIPDYQESGQLDRRNQRVSPSRDQGNRQVSRNEGRQHTPEHQPGARKQAPSTRRLPEHQPIDRQESPHSRPSTRQQPRQEAALLEGRNHPRHSLPRSQRPEAAPTPARSRISSSSKFSCPDAYGFFADPVQCDKYYECRNFTAVDSLCEDGLAFNEVSAPKYLRCDSLRDVDCSSRPELQEPRPSKNCPRRYGLYPSEEDCTKFFNCVDGTSTEVQCPPGLTFNDERATCDWADLVKSSCKTEDLLGFTCPEPSAYDLQDGVYTSYAHPDNCQLHFVCIKGVDGERRPRMLACNEGLVYNGNSGSCAFPEDVPGCEDFYQSLKPASKRKPPSIEPEDEPPKTKPRRGQNRTRN